MVCYCIAKRGGRWREDSIHSRRDIKRQTGRRKERHRVQRVSAAVPVEWQRSLFSLLFALFKSMVTESLLLSLSFFSSLSCSSALSLSLSVCTSSREAEAALALFLSLLELVITAEGAMVVVEFLRERESYRGRERGREVQVKQDENKIQWSRVEYSAVQWSIAEQPRHNASCHIATRYRYNTEGST